MYVDVLRCVLVVRDKVTDNCCTVYTTCTFILTSSQTLPVLTVFSFQQDIFSARQRMLSAYMPSPATRQSVRLSHGWINQKQLKLRLCNLHRTVVPFV